MLCHSYQAASFDALVTTTSPQWGYQEEEKEGSEAHRFSFKDPIQNPHTSLPFQSIGQSSFKQTCLAGQ